MSFCLPKEQVDKFVKALTSGEINPANLAEMSSLDRRNFLSKFVGEADAFEVNALFESKLLLKNQQRGMINWAEKVIGISPKVKADMLSKIEKLQNVLDPAEKEMFLNDLVNKRLGVEVTAEEAKTLSDFSKSLEEKKAAIPEDSRIRSKERLDYGTEFAKYREYVEQLKLNDEKMSFKDYLKNPGKALTALAGTAKSFAASLDNSFFGRQGIKTLYTNPDIWAKNFAKSWGDMAKALKNEDAMIPIKADIYSRPNALNGLYKNADLAVGLRTEEAFPSSFPEKIPLLGRLFKASEYAYNGAALRMRADIFDRVAAKAERNGIDLNNSAEIKSLGKLVNSMTGRGSVTLTPKQAEVVNATVFSIKFLKSNWDTLTAHITDSSMTPYAKKQAAMNLLKIVGTTAAILGTAKLINPDSVDFDPRSSKFGKIQIGDNKFDITGGMGSIVTLASRIVPTVHNGKFGWWTKSGTSGKFTQLSTGKYGSQTPLDVLYNFGEGKASPIFGALIDILKQEDFDGNKPTPVSIAKGFQPIGLQTFESLKDQSAGDKLMTMILDGLGFGVTTPPQKKK